MFKKKVLLFLLSIITISANTYHDHQSDHSANLTFDNNHPSSTHSWNIRTSEYNHCNDHNYNSSNEFDILSNYSLYAYPDFCSYARTLPEYNGFMVALYDKIVHDKHFRKQTARIPGFAYNFSWGHEKSEFHDFVRTQAQAIAKVSAKVSTTQQGILDVHDVQKMEYLGQQWASRSKIFVDNVRLVERINALNAMRNQKGTWHGTQLDCQLHKELCESRNRMSQLEHMFPHKYHVHILAPVVHRYAAQAKTENCPIIAFELSDFCHTITQVLSHGMDILYDTSCAVGSGVCKGATAFATIEHWRDMATGALHLGLFFVDAVGQEAALDMTMALAQFSGDSDAISHVAKNYCLHTQAQKDLAEQCIQETYQKICTMSWQDILEHGAEIGTTMILDTLALNAVGGFTRASSRAFVKQLTSAAENGALFSEQYAIEVAGFGKLIVEEGAEASVKAAEIIKNDLLLFTQNNKNLAHIAPEIKNIADILHKKIECLMKSAIVSIKGNNTAAGRAFQKHAAREGSAFVGEITGNAIKNTEQAINYINMILKSPKSTFIIRSTKSYGDVLDIRLLDGMGARWTSDGKMFIGFLEKYTTK